MEQLSGEAASAATVEMKYGSLSPVLAMMTKAGVIGRQQAFQSVAGE